uniref:Pectinesterase n=1 Tax=Brassica oleracea var. oleracea TaxID=109376 RepID=A0A0D3DYW7_BRAOL
MAILASKALFDTHPRAFMHNVLHTIKAISYSAITSVYSHHHHHHHHHHRKPSDTKKKVDICDDFPKNIPPPDTDTTSYLCVDKKGCCNFTTVQSAVDAIGNFSQKRNVIWINSGMYYEKVVIPKTKPNITLQGQGFDTTAIAWNDTAYSANGTFYCATVQVFGSQFVAKNISFMNVAPIPKPGDVGAQAVAIRIGGDQSAFLGCGFFGAQDTLHDDRGRHYFKNCYIQGSIDFIFGNAKSLYQILGSTNEIEKLQSQKSAELRVLSTPANTPTHSKVTVAIGSNSQSISSPLAGEKSAPVKSLTMEKAPSNIIVSDRQASADDHLICSPNAKTPENQHPDHDTMCYDHATGFVIGDSSTSFGLTRSGRPIKPTQKFKDMEWHTVGGRGKRGRGRGYRPPN